MLWFGYGWTNGSWTERLVPFVTVLGDRAIKRWDLTGVQGALTLMNRLMLSFRSRLGLLGLD
jgi:hypothetical protein